MLVDLRPLGEYGPFSAGTPEELAREIQFFPTHTWAHARVYGKLCEAFGLETSGSMEGPQEFSPRELLWAAERLSALVTGGPDAGRWLQIDDEILRGRKVFALREIRREFGLDLAEALELYEARRPTLRESRPFAFALMPREPAWDGDDSVTLDRLCALLLTSEDPDRFNRPRDYEPVVARARFDELVRALGSECRVAEATPPDGVTQGRIRLLGLSTEIKVGKFAQAFWVGGELPRRVMNIIRASGFGSMSPLDWPATSSEAHQPLDARTPRELAKQILALPDSPPELGSLRAWLCRELGIRDQRREAVDMPADVLVREAERLKAHVEALRQGPEAERWLAFDDEILRGARILATVAIRALFDGLDGDIQLALSVVEIRRGELAGIRPWSAQKCS